MFIVTFVLLFQGLVRTVLLTQNFRVEEPQHKAESTQNSCNSAPFPVDLIFLVDGSSRITLDQFLQIKLFMGNVANGLDFSTSGNLRISLIQFASLPRTEFSLNSFTTKDDILSMMEMSRNDLDGAAKIGQAIQHAISREMQSRNGARKESYKLLFLITDGWSDDDVVGPSEESSQFGIEIFVISCTSVVHHQNIFKITKDSKDHVLKLHEISKAQSIVNHRLVKQTCQNDELRTTTKNDGIQHASYKIECEKNRIVVSVRTVQPFKGKIYVQGYVEVPACRQMQDAFSVNDTNMFIVIPMAECGVRVGRQLNPVGIYAEATLVVSFHPVFITKSDQLINVKCFFAETSSQVSSIEFSQSEYRPKVYYLLNPTCSYNIRLNSVLGPLATVVSVGQRLLHIWECSSNFDQHTFHVHSCQVDNGHNQRATLLDERGCPEEADVSTSPLKRESDLIIVQESDAFKFSDRDFVYFACRLSFCHQDDFTCRNSFSPLVNCQARKSTRSANNTLIKNSLDVFAKLSVMEHDEKLPTDFYNQTNSTPSSNEICVQKMYIVISLCLVSCYFVLITVISYVRMLKRSVYTVQSGKQCICFK